jgi:outer membrane receptor protein involved in Fe transport
MASLHFSTRFFLIAALWGNLTALIAQTDTIPILKPEQLTVNDLLAKNIGYQAPKPISATRMPEEIADLPFSVWVITSDEIIRNGFNTLGDVLKAAPGIRVSQPGNALEGETFLVRGLSGNQYVKILINDVPIKPSIAKGMPIGAQLPIRQAERIEVYYGPAGAVYGYDACAGVVNIILKETERPIFTQADLSFGRYGYNSLDLMFGGKLGKDKRIFRFSLYGNSTIREATDVYYDENLFKTKNYLPLGLDSFLYEYPQNYRPNPSNPEIPRTSPLAHESRLLGINLTYRGVRFTYHRMKRFDHSALGLSPLAVSYTNPSNRISERMETFMLGFKRTRHLWTTYNNFSLLRYRFENPSTTNFVFDRMALSVYYPYKDQLAGNPLQKQLLLSSIYDKYLSNDRFGYTNGFDVRVESRAHTILWKKLHTDFGIQANLGGGVPYNPYYEVPVESDVFGDSPQPGNPPFGIVSEGEVTATPFVQMQLQIKKLRLNASYSSPFVLAGTDNIRQLSMPRLAALYKIDSSWSVYGNYSLSSRYPSIHQEYGRYSTILNSKIVIVEDEPYRGGRSPETVQAFEAGLRHHTEETLAQLVFFQQEVYNLMRDGHFSRFTDPFSGAEFSRYGYEPTLGRAMHLWGIQGLLRTENRDFYLSNTGKRLLRVTWVNELSMQYTHGSERFNDQTAPTASVTNMPGWMVQFRTSWQTRRFQLSFASNRQKNILSKSVWYKDLYERKVYTEKYPTFRTWDLMARAYLSNHFLLYFQMQNMFNRKYAGIDATGTVDDLLYNPQQGRIWRLGVNYNMN